MVEKMRKLSEKELNELEELVNDIETETDLGFATSYVKGKEKQGYDVRVFKNILENINSLANLEKNLDYFIQIFNSTKKLYNQN